LNFICLQQQNYNFWGGFYIAPLFCLKNELFLSVSSDNLNDFLWQVKPDTAFRYVLKKLPEYESTLNNLKNLTSDPSIKRALEKVSEYIGKVKYAQETGSLRLGNTEEALKYMDCTEFAARFLQIACGLKEVPQITSNDLAIIARGESSDNNIANYFQHIEGSKKADFTDIRPGDIFVWSRSLGDEHVGVVESYNKEHDHVYILESIGKDGSGEEKYNKEAGVSKVRRSQYTRLGKALKSHEGWEGYFRPIIKK
jgi:hypothetical protein